MMRLYIGFSCALHKKDHIFKQLIADAIYNQLNEIVAKTKPAPGSDLILIGMPGKRIHIYSGDRE